MSKKSSASVKRTKKMYKKKISKIPKTKNTRKSRRMRKSNKKSYWWKGWNANYFFTYKYRKNIYNPTADNEPI
jgi:CDP-diacylglycerol pyrophosphatase